MLRKQIIFRQFLLFYLRPHICGKLELSQFPFNHSTNNPYNQIIYLSIYQKLPYQINLKIYHFDIKPVDFVKKDEKYWDDWFG